MTQNRVIVFGASGKLGRQLVKELGRQKYNIIAVGRNEQKLNDLPAEPVVFDLSSDQPFPLKITPTDIVINAAHARYTADIFNKIGHGYKKFILIGSTRKYTGLTDPAAEQVRAAESLTVKLSPGYVILHPTMIYGAQGEDNVQRIATIAAKTKVVPLPAKLTARIQPIFIDDLVNCIISATKNNQLNQHILDVGGPQPLTYKEFLTAIFSAANIKATILFIPPFLVKLGALATRLMPFIPSVSTQEIERLNEDKAIDPSHMKMLLDIQPRSFANGLGTLFTLNK